MHIHRTTAGDIAGDRVASRRRRRAAWGLALTMVSLGVACSSVGSDGQMELDIESEPLSGAVNLVGKAASPTQVDLSWTTTLSNPASYVVKRGLSNSTLSTLATVPSGTSYVDSSAAAGTTYYYRVIATQGNIRYGSQVISVLTPTPGQFVCGDGICDDPETTTSCPADCGGLSFSATSGAITAPLYVSGASVQQNATADAIDAGSGSAIYTFNVTTAGTYKLNALVNAPNLGQNSFFINVDAQPQAPTMIWDIPLTQGFETRTVAWRGSGNTTGDPALDQYMPKTFTLNAGQHQLIVRGREAGTQVQSFAFVPSNPGLDAGVDGSADARPDTGSDAGPVTPTKAYCVGPSATGNGSGSDWNNLKAWSDTPARGDTWYLKDGVYASKTLATPSSGTATIAIKKAIGAAGQPGHGTDVGWNYASMGAGQANIPGLNLNSSHWVLDGQKGDGFSVLPLDNNGAHYGIYLSSHTAITVGTNGPGNNITDVTIKHVYAFNNPSAPDGNGYVFAMAGANRNASVSNLTISYSYFVGWGQTLCMDWDNTWSHIVWEYNVYEQMYSSPEAHGNPINVRYADVNDMTVRYSLFFGTYGTAGLSEVISANGAGIYNSKIYGNVFDQAWSGRGIIAGNCHPGAGVYDSVIYNNTFLRSDYGKPAGQPGGGLVGDECSYGNVFQNNLAYECRGAVNGGVSHDYNEYIYTTGTPTEAHGVVITSNSDPFTSTATHAYTLKTNTAPGASLGAEFSFDALGRPRTSWSRGAFEF